MPDHASRIDAIVSRRIRERRIKVGLSQTALAKFVGVSQQQMYRYETGEIRVTAGLLYEIAEHLWTDVGYFVGGSGQAMPSEGNEAVIELARDFGSITDPEVRAAVGRLVTRIARSRRKR